MDARQISESVAQADMLYRGVDKPQDAALDSRLLVLSAETGAKRSRQMQLLNQPFDVQQLMSRIAAEFLPVTLKLNADGEVDDDRDDDANDDEKDWLGGFAQFGALMSQLSVTAPHPSFMLGLIGDALK